ncbi:MAG TPA: hypothetical protein VG826_12870 [Pirellulales bacterium]|nr:hypothetical protein [Pirellulales bacterium]
MIPRPQFTLRALLVAMLVVGAFFGGGAWQYHRLALEKQGWEEKHRALQEENRQLWQRTRELGQNQKPRK